MKPTKLNYKRTKRDNSSWFERNEGLITFCSSISALLVSIFVMIDQQKASKENLKLMTEQIKLAKSQFDTANIDRNNQLERQRREEAELRQRTAYQDSITDYQLALAGKQLRNQEYLNDIAIENDKPILHLDSIIVSSGTMMIAISNKGKRTLKLKLMTLGVINKPYDFVAADTISFFHEMFPGGNGRIEFERPIPDSILTGASTYYLIRIHYEDVILKRRSVFSQVIFDLEYDSTKEDWTNLYNMSLDPRAINILERTLRTKKIDF